MKILSLQQIETRINEVFVTGKLCHMTNIELNEQVNKAMEVIRSRTPAGRLRYSVWEQGYASGLVAAHNSAIWKDVEFCYRNKDGVIYSTHKNSTHFSTEEFYSVGNGYMLADMECAHVWKGTDKPYTAWV